MEHERKNVARSFLLDEKNVAKNLKSIIGGIGLRKFAALCGVSHGQLSEYISGKRPPGLRHAYAIARAAGVSLDWLATGQNPQPERDGGDLSVSASPATPSPAAPELPPEEAELLALFHSLPAAEKKKALALLRVLGAG